MGQNITFSISIGEDLYKVVQLVGKRKKKNRSQAVNMLCLYGLAYMKLLKGGEEDLLLHKDPLKLLQLSRVALELELKNKKTLEDFKDGKKD